MNMPGVPVGGLKTVGQIDATNPLVFSAGQNGLEIALIPLCFNLSLFTPFCRIP